MKTCEFCHKKRINKKVNDLYLSNIKRVIICFDCINTINSNNKVIKI